MWQIWVPFPEKNLQIRRRHENIFKGLFTLFLGLTSLNLVNAQPNSKLHSPPPKFFDPLLRAKSSFFLEFTPFEICSVRPWCNLIVNVEAFLYTRATMTISISCELLSTWCGRSGLGLLGRSNRTHCCPLPATAAMAFQCRVTHALNLGGNPATRHTLRLNPARIMIWGGILLNFCALNAMRYLNKQS